MKRFFLILSILLWASISWATVSSETMLVQTSCNGTTTKYYFTFTIYADTDIKVVSINDTTDVETALTLNSDYTVSVSGKYVTLTAGTKCPSGSTLNLISNVPATQATEFTDGDALSASTLNNALDKLTIISAQLKAGKTTSVGSPGSDDKYPSEKAVRAAISAGGNGDVSGPSAVTNNTVARFDDTTGKLIQGSNVTIDDSGSVNIPSGQTYNINGSAHTHTTEVSDTAYNATSWDGVTTIAPSKNAVRDKFESLSIPSKASSSEAQTGTDDDKFVTAKAIKDSVNIPNVAPGTSGNVLTSDGSAWKSSAPSGGNSFVAPNSAAVATVGQVVGMANTERSTTSTTYTFKKQITVKKAGTYTVVFQAKSAGGMASYYAKIYKNDSELGTERTSMTSASYTTYTESFTFAAGDKVQLYLKTSDALYAAYCKDFQIQAHDDNLATIDTD